MKRGARSAPAEPQVLRPYDRAEAITAERAADMANRDVRTVRRWCVEYDIGRRVAGGPWAVSTVALRMLLDGDEAALHLYLAGDRTSPSVILYFEAAGLKHLIQRWRNSDPVAA